MTTQINNWEGLFYPKGHIMEGVLKSGITEKDLMKLITLAKAEERKRLLEIIKSCKSTLRPEYFTRDTHKLDILQELINKID